MSGSPLRPVALVTGAASGIGAATVRAIAATCEGLVLHTRGSNETSRGALETIASIARQQGAEVATLTGDLGEPGAGRRVVEAALARFGRLDHLVANAGFADKRGIAELTRADLDRSHAAMAGAFFEMVQTASPALRASGSGRVVYLSSFVAHRFVAGGLFPASAAEAWRRAAEATPLGRIAEPADIAALIAFLLSPAARHITGQAIAVDGGLSLG